MKQSEHNFQAFKNEYADCKSHIKMHTLFIKKLLLILGFTISGFTFLNAQSVKYGAKAGVNIANISFSTETYKDKPIIGIHIGGFGNYAINDKLAVQTELLFSTEGNKWDGGLGYNGKTKLTQIRIPILIQYILINNLSLEGGLQYGLLLSAKQTSSIDNQVDIKEYYKSGNLGYAIGVGYDLSDLVTGLKAGLRYNGDFSKLNNADDLGGGDLKNSVIQISFSYNFSK